MFATTATLFLRILAWFALAAGWILAFWLGFAMRSGNAVVSFLTDQTSMGSVATVVLGILFIAFVFWAGLLAFAYITEAIFDIRDATWDATYGPEEEYEV